MNTRHSLNFAVAALLASLAIAHAQPNFTQVTNTVISDDIGQWVGCVWGDFRNSGYQDLIVCDYSGGYNAYYQNNVGTFTKITQGNPVQDADYHIYGGPGDYDNDGFLDLFITAGAYAPDATHNRLYHNNGDGSFTSVSGGGVTNQLGHYGACAWGDYDNDGFLDLFVADHGLSNDNGGKNQLFHNNGDGTFTAITSGPVVNDTSIGYCATWEDYDNDGYADLLVINNEDNGSNFLYHNNGDRTFTKITTNIIATDRWPQGALSAAWGDYDNDGLPDLYITDQGGVRNQLYHNSGGGAFTRVASGSELTSGGEFNGCAWGDYDNDGYLDLFVSGADEKNALFHNNGNGTFTKITSGPAVISGGPGIVCAAVSWVDYDNDGFLDLFVGQYSNNGLSESLGQNQLFHNDGNSNAWLEVKLVGTVANRAAIGAKVRTYATIGGKTFWQLREITSGGGYNSPPLVAHFGLGDATNVTTLRIEWPSGTVQEIPNVAARQILTITEPPRLLATITNGVPQFFLKAWPHMQFDIQSSTNLADWSLLGTVIVSNMNGIVEFVDTNALDSTKFYRAVSH